jgi:hypothetical protein
MPFGYGREFAPGSISLSCYSPCLILPESEKCDPRTQWKHNQKLSVERRKCRRHRHEINLHVFGPVSETQQWPVTSRSPAGRCLDLGGGICRSVRMAYSIFGATMRVLTFLPGCTGQRPIAKAFSATPVYLGDGGICEGAPAVCPGRRI